mgnify:FL=1
MKSEKTNSKTESFDVFVHAKKSTICLMEKVESKDEAISIAESSLEDYKESIVVVSDSKGEHVWTSENNNLKNKKK